MKLQNIKRLRLRPGEILVAVIPRRLATKAAMEKTRAALVSVRPQAAVLVMSEECSLQVLDATALAEMSARIEHARVAAELQKP